MGRSWIRLKVIVNMAWLHITLMLTLCVFSVFSKQLIGLSTEEDSRELQGPCDYVTRGKEHIEFWCCACKNYIENNNDFYQFGDKDYCKLYDAIDDGHLDNDKDTCCAYEGTCSKTNVNYRKRGELVGKVVRMLLDRFFEGPLPCSEKQQR